MEIAHVLMETGNCFTGNCFTGNCFTGNCFTGNCFTGNSFTGYYRSTHLNPGILIKRLSYYR